MNQQPGVIPQFTVPVGGQKKKSTTAAVLTVVIILLVILVIFVMWRRRYRAKPNCGSYTGMSGQACSGMAAMCSSNGGCLNAVAQCMPLVDGMAKLQSLGGPPTAAQISQVISGLDGPALKSCSRAITNMDPSFLAQLAVKSGGSMACIPPQLKTVFSDPHNYNAAHNVLAAAAPLVPYAFDVARRLPACPPHAAASTSLLRAGALAPLAPPALMVRH